MAQHQLLSLECSLGRSEFEVEEKVVEFIVWVCLDLLVFIMVGTSREVGTS